MKKEDLKKIILKVVKHDELHGYDIHKKLKSENVKVEISRVYIVLNEMLKERLLESRWYKSQFGPRKKVYQLSMKGKKEFNKFFSDAIEIIHDYYKDYILNLPNTSVFEIMCKLFKDEFKGQENIAYITSKGYSVMHKMMINTLHRKVPRGRIYLVKPSSMVVDHKLDNLLLLDGACDEIPLKSGYVDLIVVSDFPKKNFLEKALMEWHRVLTQNGTLAIFTPTVLVEEYEHPMSIGSFIEQHEHQTTENSKHMKKKFIRAQLKTFFQKVEERKIVHLTIFRASKPRFPVKKPLRVKK